MQLSGLDYMIGHGPSKFVKPERVAALQRQEKESQPAKFELCLMHTACKCSSTFCVCVCAEC